MIGLLLITHGKMSDGLADAANMILGHVENLEVLNLLPEDNASNLKDLILNAHQNVDKGNGVIIFTDLFSATPFNQSTIAINSLPKEKQKKTFVFSGVNLPMLIETINQNMIGASIEQAVDAIENTGKEGIVRWSISDISADDDDDF